MMFSDVQGILGVDLAEAKKSKKAASREKKKDVKKVKKSVATVAKNLLPDSMGINIDGIVSQISEAPSYDHLLASRKKFGKKPARKWKLVEFTNSARADGLILSHYKRVDHKEGEYPFAAFNRKYPIPQYSNELYDVAFVDKDWSKEETGYLMEMADRFNLIWPVISDRYSFNGKQRNVMEIRKRFHFIDDFVKAFNDEQPSGFDFGVENERRTTLENYLSATIEEVEEEEKALREFDRLKRRENELLTQKKSKDFQQFAKATKPGSLAMLNAARIRQRNLNRRSVRSPQSLSPLKSPTSGLNANIKEIIDFAMTSKPMMNIPDFGIGAQSASEIVTSGPNHKVALFNAIHNFYEGNKVYSLENARDTFRMRKNLNSIAEYKGSLLLLHMELESTLQALKSSNIRTKPVQESCTIDHFMRQRKSVLNSRLLLASIFSILPAIFPPAKIIDYESGEPKRRRNAAITFPEGIEVPEGLIAKQYLSPSPSPSRVQQKSKKSGNKKNNESPSTPLTIELPDSASKKPKRPSVSRKSSGLPSPSSPSTNDRQKRRRLSTASGHSPVPSPKSPSVVTRSGRTIGKKSWHD
ncbi:hypothetical protein FO519_004580 [Halicephalobus sp. NKZ332]|nr:hypothetical protein FO519_004580 [Halicephalobus sp. NKZ332]